MQHTTTRKIFFSLDQPEQILATLLTTFQAIRTNADTSHVTLTPLHAHTVLLLDADTQRARYIAYQLSSAGYKSFIVASSLEAFTLFLQGAFVPFVILLGQEDINSRFFLSRLLQQVSQKYQWDTPLLSLYTQRHTTALLNTKDFTPVSGPLEEFSPILHEMSPHISTQTTAPLPQIVETPPQTLRDIEQLPFPPLALPQFVAKNGPPEPIINRSTHESQGMSGDVQKISLEGISIGRYQMKTVLGGGPFGEVYQTYDRLRERDVALKAVQMNILPPELSTGIEAEKNFFQQEIDLLSRLSHPHILSPLNCGKSYISGSPFVYKTMPYCTEGSVATLLYQLSSTRLLYPQEAVHILMQVAGALQQAHTYNITYQNFKLTNLLIRSKEQDIRQVHILLSDFAVAQNGSFLVKTPDVFPYIAPERWNGQSLPASYQYGLAAIAYELLTGRVPFTGQSEHIMRQLHLSMQPQPLTLFAPAVSTALSAVVLRGLAKRSEDRFPSIMDFSQALYKYSR